MMAVEETDFIEGAEGEGNFPEEVLDGADEFETEETEEVSGSGEDDSEVEGSDDSEEATEFSFDEVEAVLNEFGVSDVKDLRDHLLRQSDYTRKTQELAGDRETYAAYKVLDQHWRTDPLGTLQKLAATQGWDVSDPNEVNTSTESDSDELDPIAMAKELRDLREWRRNVDQNFEVEQTARRRSQTEAEIEAVKVNYSDPDLDAVELLKFAIERGIVDLDSAYRALNFGKTPASAKTSTKKKGLPPVEGGGARNRKMTQRGSSKFLDLEEALLEAKEELGYSFG